MHMPEDDAGEEVEHEPVTPDAAPAGGGQLDETSPAGQGGTPATPPSRYINNLDASYEEGEPVIADRNYAVGEQVMIRYGKYSNATLALNFGFTLSRNIYDQARILVDMRDQEPLWAKKIDIWEKHRHPKYEDMPSCSWSKDSFVIKGVKSTKGKGMGVPEILRAFFRVFGATSPEDLFEMTVEATRTDGRLARRPLENIEKEIQAHRMLLLHLHDKIQTYSTAIEVRIPNVTENSLI
ncbi:hypothetical protein PR202_ga08146 [Eleusine coracana subsp. coracana]|uniref:Uncharacterized protein n=1 Tax=Eleusine coracana subsp. coracana TaxID=191504 RepID=A0AAV5BZA2_ELECO|nr:hypothetical protein PR202_ga08146 [Eleusine coracana subsp. coracana]